MGRKLATLTLLLSCLFCAPAELRPAEGYFRVEQRAGVWWFITPSGHPALSIGVNNISYRGDVIHGTTQHPYFENISKIYPDQNAWVQAETKRSSLWAFNTIGSWSDPALWGRPTPYAVILDIATSSGADETPPDPVLRASADTDVVSVDIYRFDPRPTVEHIYRLTRRPALVARIRLSGRGFRPSQYTGRRAQGAKPGRARPRVLELREMAGKYA